MSEENFVERVERIAVQQGLKRKVEITRYPKGFSPCSMSFWGGTLRVSAALVDARDEAITALIASAGRAQKKGILALVGAVIVALAFTYYFQFHNVSIVFLVLPLYPLVVTRNEWSACLRQGVSVENLFKTIASFRYNEMLQQPGDRFDYGSVALYLRDELEDVSRMARRIKIQVPDKLVDETIAWAKTQYPFTNLPTTNSDVTPHPYSSSIDKRYR